MENFVYTQNKTVLSSVGLFPHNQDSNSIYKKERLEINKAFRGEC